MSLSLDKNGSLSPSQTAASPIKVCMHVLGSAATDQRVMREATALAQAGYMVSIVDIAEQASQPGEEIVRGVCLRHVGVSRAFLATRFDKHTLLRLVALFTRSLLRLLRTPADMYHAHDVSALPTCFLAATLRRKPLIFDAHEMPLFERPLADLGRSRRWLRSVLAMVLSFILPRCAGIITVSPPIVRELRQRYRVGPITLVRNVPEYRAVKQEDLLRQHLGLAPETHLALYQGYLQANRGLDKLVRAAPFLEPGIVIVLMGQNRQTTQAQLEAWIANENVAERVKFVPAVPYADLLNWTASADIGLNVAPPDYSLNVRCFLPNKFFEYVMAGLPILTSPLESIVEIVQAYDLGCVLPSLEPEDIATAIKQMLADSTALARQRRNALEIAKSEFHWEKERAQLLQLYAAISRKRGWASNEAHPLTVNPELSKENVSV